MNHKTNDASPKLIIDWSVISYKNWFKMGSPNYEPETGNEGREFASNMYLFVLYLTEMFRPIETIFAVDSRPTWRDEVYKDYYVDNMKIAQKFHFEGDGDKAASVRVFEKEYIAQFDQKTIRYFYSDEAQKWMMKKMVKADIAQIIWENYKPVGLEDTELREKLELDEDEDITQYMEQGSDIRQAIDDLNREKKKDVIYNILKGLTPAYKGTRSTASSWDFSTPKNGYTDESGAFIPGFRELSNGISETLAGTFGAKVVKADNAEADDVIAHYVKNDKSGRDIILVSVDSDLHQLYLDSMFFKYWNPNVDEEGKYSQYGGFVDLNKTSVRYNLRKKMLSGDSSDNIFGCGQLDPKGNGLKATLVGAKTAEKWLTEFKMKEIVHLVEKKSLARNRKLIHLDNIPKSVNKTIAKAFKKAKSPEFVDHEEYGASPLKVLTTRQAAMYRRGSDEEAEELDSEIETAPNHVPQKALEDMSKEELIEHNKCMQIDLDREKSKSHTEDMGK